MVTILSVTLVLAYIHYYTPKLLPRGCFLAPKHLRRLSEWIGFPRPKLRSLATHKPLAAHLALLKGAGLLSFHRPTLALHPTATQWLHAPSHTQLDQLIAVAADPAPWQAATADLKLQECLTHDYRVYLYQTLCRQQNDHAPPPAPAAQLATTSTGTWTLTLPQDLPPWLHFALRQLGHWSPDGPLVCTPLTIATAVERGRTAHTIRWLLQTATGQSLSPAQSARLDEWARRATTYRLQPVHLLRTAQPEQLKAILRRKRFRPFLVEQLSSRCAVVRPEVAPSLARWLEKQGYPLHQPMPQECNAAPATDLAYRWLGLRLLVGLGSLIDLPYPAPHELLADVGRQLPPDEQTRLEQIAQKTLAGLREAIRGRDAFFPALEPASADHLAATREGLRQERILTIHYQGPGDAAPRRRHIQPLRLEQRGALYYLHAYCYLAERTLTFRLDRMTECELDG